MLSGWESVKIGNSSMPLYVSLPESGAPVPGIVVVHGQSGLEDFIKDTTVLSRTRGRETTGPHAVALSWPKAMEIFSRHWVDSGSR
jgi:hypothetical protein